MKTKSKKRLSILFILLLLLNLFTVVIPPTVIAQENSGEYCGDTLLMNYISQNFSGRITVTIAALRPVANSRVVINIENHDSGHTFVRLDFGDGNVIARGFYSYGMTIAQTINNTSIKGELKDDSTHDWNAAVVYEITLDQAGRIKDYINSFDVDDFRVVSSNCTTFAVNALASAGISPPTQKHKWTLPNRNEIIAALPFYILDKSTVANQFLNKTYYGYSPADAVQDFKSNENCILKYDGVLRKP